MTGKLIAIEGADGAGKHTTAEALAVQLRSLQNKVIVFSFPAYGETLSAAILGEVLGGRREMPADPRAFGVLFSLDRFECLGRLKSAVQEADYVVVDRYTASNAAYQSAIVGDGEISEICNWFSQLEYEVFSLPRPHLNVLLDTDERTASAFQASKAERKYTSEIFDRFERDQSLQRSVRHAYHAIAENGFFGRWFISNTVQHGILKSPELISKEIIQQLEGCESKRN